MGRIYSNSPIFHQSALILKRKNCLLSHHDYFDYNSTNFSQVLEKKVGSGEWPSVCDHLDVKEMSVSINTLEQTLNSLLSIFR